MGAVGKRGHRANERIVENFIKEPLKNKLTREILKNRIAKIKIISQG